MHPTANRPEHLVTLLQQLVELRSWDAVASTIERHPELLSRQAGRVLGELSRKDSPEPDALWCLYRYHRGLMRLFRQKGVQSGLASLSGQFAPTSAVGQSEAALSMFHGSGRYLAEAIASLTPPRRRRIRLLSHLLRGLPHDADPSYRALLDSDLGREYMLAPGVRRKNLRHAIAHYTAAVVLHERQGDTVKQAMAEIGLGQAYRELPDSSPGDLQRALESLRNAQRILKPEQWPQEFALAHLSMAQLYLSFPTGDQAGFTNMAIHACFQALRFYDPWSTPVEYAKTLCTLGDAYMGPHRQNIAHSLRQSIACHRAAAECGAGRSPARDLGLVYNHLGAAQRRLADEEEEEAYLFEAIESYQRGLHLHDDRHWPLEHASGLNNLGIAYARLAKKVERDFARSAARCFERAARLFRQQRSDASYATALANLATALRLGATDAAAASKVQTHYEDALAYQHLLSDPRSHRRTATHLGDVLSATGDWTGACRAYSSARQAHDLLYESTDGETPRRRELGQNIGITTRHVYALLKTHRYPEALEALESGRVRALTRSLSSQVQRHESPNRGEEHRLLPRGAGHSDMRPLVHDDVEPAHTISREQSRSERTVNSKASPMIAYLATTQHGSVAVLVPPDSSPTDGQNVVWLPGFSEGDLYDILGGSAQHESYQRAALFAPSDKFRVTLQAVAQTIGRHVMGPMIEKALDSGCERITLIPCGLLSLLPWHAAVLPDGRFVDEILEISYAPSASALSLMAQFGEASGERSLLAIADPSHSEQVVLNDLSIALPMPALPLAHEEIMAVSSLLDTQNAVMLEAEHATRDSVLTALPSVTHVHFACHGVYYASRPLDSGLAMAGAEWLTVRDILNIKRGLGWELVVLSACQTLLSDFRDAPDELLGLPGAFIRAGARTVLGTCWPIPDNAAKMLMTRFYESYAGHGNRPGEALREAQQWLRNATARELGLVPMAGSSNEDDVINPTETTDELHPYSHPYYWGAFALYGIP